MPSNDIKTRAKCYELLVLLKSIHSQIGNYNRFVMCGDRSTIDEPEPFAL